MRAVQGRHANRVRRRSEPRASHVRGRAARRRRRQGWSSVRWPVGCAARSRARRCRHFARRRLCHQRGEAFQVGARRAHQAASPQDAERERSARLPAMARTRDRARASAGHRLPGRDSGQVAPRLPVQRAQIARHGAADPVGRVAFATVHPSAVLRARRDQRERAERMFVADLRGVARAYGESGLGGEANRAANA